MAVGGFVMPQTARAQHNQHQNEKRSKEGTFAAFLFIFI